MDCIMETINKPSTPAENTPTEPCHAKETTFRNLMLLTIAHWGIEYGDSLSHYSGPIHGNGQQLA